MQTAEEHRQTCIGQEMRGRGGRASPGLPSDTGAIERACQCSEPRNQTKIKGQSNPQAELKANIGRKRDGFGIKKLLLFSTALSRNDGSVGDCLRLPRSGAGRA